MSADETYAFPRPEILTAAGRIQPASAGMLLRDYFACGALPQVIADCKHDTLEEGVTRLDYFARGAYEIADAMLRARSA